MELERAKTVDEIFEEVKDHDLVLTTDAPLADALNARLKEPRQGLFAATPRRLAFTRSRAGSRRELFLEIVQESDMSWKQASFLLDSVLDCWMETGELEAIEQYERFSGQETRQIIEIIKGKENPYSAIEEYEVEGDVAVVAPYRFNELDRKILPEDYDRIDVFTGEKTELPQFNVFSSATAIVQAVVGNLEEPENTAIVLGEDSRYQPLIESALESRDIPYNSEQGFAQDEELRTFIGLLRLSFSQKRLRLRDVQPVLNYLDLEVPGTKDNAYISELGGPVEEFRELLNVVDYLSFREVVESLEKITEESMDTTLEILEELGLLEEEVSEENVSRLEYYIESFDPLKDSDTGGVLLASPKSSVFIDRETVFYLGMDASWTQEVDDRPWIDREERERSNLKDFRILLQNGSRQYFIVQDREFNEEITPCYYFNELSEIESFTDHRYERFEGLETVDFQGFEREDYDVETEKIEMLSQSSLNKFVKSPRAYYFSRLVSDPDEVATVKGRVFHDFAEYYVNYPEDVEQRGLEKFVELGLEELEQFADELKTGQLRTELRVGMENIVEFIDSREIEGSSSYDSWRDENDFAQHFGKEIDSRVSEAGFQNPELGGKGKIDLLASDTHLVDYKSSGYMRSRSKVVEASNVELFDDPDFQPIMYLAQHRRRVPDEKLKFTYYYFLGSLGDDVTTGADMDDRTVTVEYYPENFQEWISKTDTFEKLIRGVAKSNPRRKTLEKLGLPRYREFFSENRLPHEFDEEPLLESEFAAEFEKFAKKHVGDYRYVEKGCRKTLKKLVKFRRENYFSEDLDRFEEFLQDKIDELNRCRKEGFPVGDADPDDTRYTDMMVE
ncbi:MAG: PD-(D/E)XK nuclease family protein [Candidatus Nanohaloarchaea archaeon]